MSEEQVENSAPEVKPEVEKEARILGWVPKEEFRDGDHWVDAETFVKRGKEINPILRKNNETLLKKLEQAQSEITEVKKVAKEFEVFQKELATKRVAEVEAQLKDLREQKKAAIATADGEAVVAIDDAIDSLKAEKALAEKPKVEAKPEQPTVVLDPIITNWMDKNTWFSTDQKWTRIADALGATINAEKPTLSGQAFFDELDEQLKELYPEKFAPRSNPVEGGRNNNRPTPKGKHTYENLPSDAKEACNRFVKQGFMTRDQYVNDYDWSAE